MPVAPKVPATRKFPLNTRIILWLVRRRSSNSEGQRFIAFTSYYGLWKWEFSPRGCVFQAGAQTVVVVRYPCVGRKELSVSLFATNHDDAPSFLAVNIVTGGEVAMFIFNGLKAIV